MVIALTKDYFVKCTCKAGIKNKSDVYSAPQARSWSVLCIPMSEAATTVPRFVE